MNGDQRVMKANPEGEGQGVMAIDLGDRVALSISPSGFAFITR